MSRVFEGRQQPRHEPARKPPTSQIHHSKQIMKALGTASLM